jgi:hypothetical protein
MIRCKDAKALDPTVKASLAISETNWRYPGTFSLTAETILNADTGAALEGN